MEKPRAHTTRPFSSASDKHGCGVLCNEDYLFRLDNNELDFLSIIIIEKRSRRKGFDILRINLVQHLRLSIHIEGQDKESNHFDSTINSDTSIVAWSIFCERALSSFPIHEFCGLAVRVGISSVVVSKYIVGSFSLRAPFTT